MSEDFSRLEVLYELVSQERDGEALDWVLDIFYEKEGPALTVLRVGQESGIINGRPIETPSEQLFRIDNFLYNVP